MTGRKVLNGTLMIVHVAVWVAAGFLLCLLVAGCGPRHQVVTCQDRSVAGGTHACDGHGGVKR